MSHFQKVTADDGKIVVIRDVPFEESQRCGECMICFSEVDNELPVVAVEAVAPDNLGPDATPAPMQRE
jgi:hypothetical protein